LGRIFYHKTQNRKITTWYIAKWYLNTS
jgi:hypothetical protein